MKVGARVNPFFYEEIGIQALLKMLRNAGCEALEFGMAPGGHPEWPVRDDILGMCRDLGMAFSHHTRMKVEAFEQPEWAALADEYEGILEWLESAAERLGQTINLVIHWTRVRLDKPGGPEWHALMDRTIRGLNWFVGRTGPNLRWQLENATWKPTGHSVGDRHDTLLAIRKGVGEDRLDICWDIGHEGTFRNGTPDTLTPEFLRAVGHLHVSDLRQEEGGIWGAHYPPFYGNVPFQEHLRALAEVGCKGALILEVQKGIGKLGAGPEGLAASVRVLRTIRDQVCS